MRLVVTALFVAMSFIPYAMVQFPAAAAAPGCSCKGCGCKGGPGWRGPNGTCVAEAKLASVCGSPATAPCTHEAATHVCFASPFDAAAEDRTDTQ